MKLIVNALKIIWRRSWRMCPLCGEITTYDAWYERCSKCFWWEKDGTWKFIGKIE